MPNRDTSGRTLASFSPDCFHSANSDIQGICLSPSMYQQDCQHNINNFANSDNPAFRAYYSNTINSTSDIDQIDQEMSSLPEQG
jgi:hypothetical protein